MIKKITCVTSKKGGVGKTTVTINVGYQLAKAGKKVLIVDLCDSGAASDYLGRLNEEYNIEQVLLDKKYDPKYSIHPALQDQIAVDNLFIMPSASDLAHITDRINRMRGREDLLLNQLKRIDFDHILIDTGPNNDIFTINGLCAANRFLIPTEEAGQAMKAIWRHLELISQLHDCEIDDLDYRVVRTKVDIRATTVTNFAEAALDGHEDKLMSTMLRTEAQYKKSDNAVSIITRDFPSGKAAKDYSQFISLF